MTTKSLRKISLILRTTLQEKIFLQNAAEIAGFSNLTNFVMTAARKEAYRILSETNATYLSPKNWKKIHKLISHPPTPDKKLIELLSNHD